MQIARITSHVHTLTSLSLLLLPDKHLCTFHWAFLVHLVDLFSYGNNSIITLLHYFFISIYVALYSRWSPMLRNTFMLVVLNLFTHSHITFIFAYTSTQSISGCVPSIRFKSSEAKTALPTAQHNFVHHFIVLKKPHTLILYYYIQHVNIYIQKKLADT